MTPFVWQEHIRQTTPKHGGPPIPSIKYKHHGRAESSLYLCLDDLAILAEGALERALRGVPRQPADEDPPHLVLRHLGPNQSESPRRCLHGKPPAKSHQETEISHRSAQRNRANRVPTARGGRRGGGLPRAET